MGVSGLGQIGCIDGSGTTATGTNDRHVGMITSDTLPNGTPIILTGTVTVTWNHASDGDFAIQGTHRVYVFDAVFLAPYAIIELNLDSVAGGVQVNSMNSHGDSPDGLYDADIDEVTIPFVFSSKVGDIVRLEFDSASSLDNATGNSQLNFEMTIEAFEEP